MPPWNFFNMSQNQIRAAALCHFGFQGILAALLPIVLSKESDETWQLKSHIILVNALALGQTAIGGMPVFSDSVQGGKRTGAPPFIPPTFNALLAMSVQAFYLLRCWRIVGRRWRWITPFLLLWLMASGSAIAMSVLNSDSARSSDLSEHQKTAWIWVFGSFALDLLMTSTTGVYLYKSHTGTSQPHTGVFFTAWNVIWAAAVPPMAIMVAIMIDGYMVSNSNHSYATFFSDISGKIYALSMMITLAGRGYVRQKLSEVNIGRMSSGMSHGRSVSHDPAPSRSIIIRYQQERIVSEGVAVQLSEFSPRNKSSAPEDQNDCDVETAPSQYSKTDENKYHL